MDCDVHFLNLRYCKLHLRQMATKKYAKNELKWSTLIEFIIKRKLSEENINQLFLVAQMQYTIIGTNVMLDYLHTIDKI